MMTDVFAHGAAHASRRYRLDHREGDTWHFTKDGVGDNAQPSAEMRRRPEMEAQLVAITEAGVCKENHADLRIIIETIDHSKRRYPTVGDWQWISANQLRVTVSKMSDPRYEFLIGMHEAIEAYLAIHAGISPEAVDKVDMTYEKHRRRGDKSEPGDDPKAPYHREHVFATKGFRGAGVSRSARDRWPGVDRSYARQHEDAGHPRARRQERSQRSPGAPDPGDPGFCNLG